MFFKKNTKFDNIPSIFNITASEIEELLSPMYKEMKYSEIENYVDHWREEIHSIYKSVKKGADFEPAIVKLNKIMDLMQEYITKPYSVDVIGGEDKCKGIKDAFYKTTFDLENKINESTYKKSYKKFKLDRDNYLIVYKAIQAFLRAAYEMQRAKTTGFVPLGVAVATEVTDGSVVVAPFAEVVDNTRRPDRP